MHTYANVFFCFSPGGDTPPLHTVSASMSVCYVAVCYVACAHMSAIVLFCSLKAWATDGWSKAHVGQSCWPLAIKPALS